MFLLFLGFGHFGDLLIIKYLNMNQKSAFKKAWERFDSLEEAKKYSEKKLPLKKLKKEIRKGKTSSKKLAKKLRVEEFVVELQKIRLNRRLSSV